VTTPDSEQQIFLADPLEQVGRVHVRHRGRKLIYFGGCDYYRLASYPHLKTD
jgi:hypothetical protein